MANWGIFAGGVGNGLIDLQRLQMEKDRLEMAKERERRLNEMSDLQLEAARKKAAEESDTAAFETEADKVMAKVGEQSPFSVGGVKFDDRSDAQQASAQQGQANLRAMDNAMEAFQEGKTPGINPTLRDDQVTGGGTYGKQNAFSELGALAGKYKNLPPSKAREMSHQMYAQRAFETIQQAATLPNKDEAIRIMVNTIDSIPDGRRVTARQTGNGFEIGYVDEKTGQPIGRPQVYRSVEDAMYRYASALTPQGLTRYLEQNVKDQNQYALDQQKQNAALRIASSRAPSRSTAPIQPNLEDEVDLSGKIQTYLKNAIQDGGESFETPDGESVLVSREQLSTEAAREALRIRRANPSIPFTEAADIGLSITKTKHGADPAAVDYRPVPQLQTDGSWQMRIRTNEGREFAYPVPVDSVSPKEVFTQESSLVDRWVQAGEGTQLEQRIKNPADREKIIKALSQQGAEQVPNLRKVMMLNAYAGVGGDLGVPSLARKRQEVADMRGSLRSKPKAKQRSMFSDEELAVAKQQGVEPVTPITEQLSRVGRAVSGAASAVTGALDNSFVQNTRQKMRSSGVLEQGDAIALYEAIADTPSLKSQFTDEELTAIQVAAGRRFK